MRNLLSVLFVFSVFLMNAQTADKGCSSSLKGKVKNFMTDEIIKEAEVELYKDGELLKTVKVSADGAFRFKLDCSRSRYNVRGIAENYTLNSKIVYSSSKGGDKELDLKLYPKREFVERNSNKYIDTEPIVFDLDNEKINEATATELQKVVDVMKKYNDLILSVDVHTDSKSEPEYAVEITTQRAGIIINYLAGKGVDVSRMEAHGVGNAQLKNHCARGVKCPEELHRQNRRIEFLVIE